jgi:DNA-binding response OmpR family regulator
MAASVSFGGRSRTRAVRFKRVFILDPDEPWGRVVQRELASNGYRVHLLTNPDDAMDRFRERQTDLVILSTGVGNWQLQSVCRGLEGMNPPPRVILVLGPQDPDQGEATRYLSPAATLRRPCSAQEIADAVRKHVGKPWADLPDAT